MKICLEGVRECNKDGLRKDDFVIHTCSLTGAKFLVYVFTNLSDFSDNMLVPPAAGEEEIGGLRGR